MKHFILLISMALGCNSCIPQNPVATELHTGIYRINNQYFYSEKVHTYLLELEDEVLLFDIPTYSQEVKEFILTFDKPVVAIISHGSCGIEDGSRWQEEIGLRVYAHQADKDHPWIRMEPDVLFTEIPDFGDTVQVIHTPGHSAGSICMLEKTSKSLFTGDTFYGNKKGEVKDFTRERQSSYENLDNRIRSCQALLPYDFENIYPFHYEPILGKGKKSLIEYLDGL